jgi:hypothetical protein
MHSQSSPSTAFVAGALANKPGSGGEAWVRLSWIRGLQRLGWEVVFVEQIASAVCVDALGRPALWEASENRRFFDRVVADFGLDGSAAVIVDGGAAFHGLSREELLDRAAEASLLLNISGHLDWEPLFGRLANRVYLDIDPGFTQFWQAQGTGGSRLEGHDAYYTVGLNVGAADCCIPTCGIRWRHVLPPVVLDDWPVARGDGGRETIDRDAGRFTTVANWRGPFGPITHAGNTFGLKVHEFRKFLDLPARSGLPFEIALAIHPGDAADRDRLVTAGWHLAEPATVAADPRAFRDYASNSRAEFSVAQGVYVDTHSGWFSDRTVRYLAAGRPALVQDTGFSRHLPTGTGLVTFRTPEEAAAGAADIVARYDEHRAAARAIAEHHFDSDRVLSALLADLPA